MTAFEHKKQRINVDLIHGIKGTTTERVVSDILDISKFNVPKITVYAYRNYMIFPFREGLEENKELKETALIKDREEYKNYFIQEAQKIKNSLPSNYVWDGAEKDRFKEYNFAYIPENAISFKHSYLFEPLHFNNTIAFGHGTPDASIIAIGKYIHTNTFNDTMEIYDFFDESFKDILIKNEDELDIPLYYEDIKNNRAHPENFDFNKLTMELN